MISTELLGLNFNHW